MARVHDEDLGRVVTMLGVDAAERLARRADVEALSFRYVDVLVGVFRDAALMMVKFSFSVDPGVGIGEGGAARAWSSCRTGAAWRPR